MRCPIRIANLRNSRMVYVCIFLNISKYAIFFKYLSVDSTRPINAPHSTKFITRKKMLERKSRSFNSLKQQSLWRLEEKHAISETYFLQESETYVFRPIVCFVFSYVVLKSHQANYLESGISCSRQLFLRKGILQSALETVARCTAPRLFRTVNRE